MCFQERTEVCAANFLLALDDEDQVDGQFSVGFEGFLHADDVGEDLSLVVRGTPRVDDVPLDPRLEGRRFAKIQGVGGLHVVVAVDHHRRSAFPALVARDDDRMAGGRMLLGLQTHPRELEDEPVRAFVHLGLERRISRDAGEPQELDEIGDGVILGGVARQVAGHQAHGEGTVRRMVGGATNRWRIS